VQSRNEIIIKNEKEFLLEVSNNNNTYIKIIWMTIYLLNAVLVNIPISALVYLNGWDIFILFLKTSYRVPWVLFLFISLSFSACYIWLFVLTALSLARKASFRPPYLLNTISAVFALALIFSAVWVPLKVRAVVNGDHASAAENFTAGAGPFIQPGPFMNRSVTGNNSLVIWWINPAKTGSNVLLFGKIPVKEKMTEIRPVISEGQRHEVHLTGLIPGTTYYYCVPGRDGTVRHFTAMPDSSEKPERLFFIGDTGNTRNGGFSFSFYEKINELAMSYYEDNRSMPSWRIHLGDLVKYGSDLRAWETFFTIDLPWSGTIPTAMTMGNHEYLKDHGGNFRYFFSHPDYYSFDSGKAHILVIHSFDGFHAKPDGPLVTTAKAQYEFIIRDLEKNTNKKWIIVCLHIPVLSTGDYNINELLVRQYVGLFRKYRVDLVVSGHDHNYDSFHLDRKLDYGGKIYIVAGTGGSRTDSYIMTRKKKQWRGWTHDGNSPLGKYQSDEYTDNYHLYGELSWGFLDVEITKNKLVTTYHRWLDIEKYLSLTGQTMESWEMVPMDPELIKQNGLDKTTPAHRIEKERRFEGTQ